MKSINQIRIVKNLKTLFLILFIISTRTIYSQVDKDGLVKKAEDIISPYYTEKFDISSDQNGTVTVNGEVETLFDKLKIGELISWVEGVKNVNNKIEVKTDMLPDGIIKANIDDELQRNNEILEPEKINVTVKDGTVHLSGLVNNIREKLLAQSISSWQEGVTGIKSDLALLSSSKAISDQNLREIFSDIFKRDFSLEKNIKISVNDGEVFLSGKTKSSYAENHIPEKIRNIPGVKNVINEISLDKNYN